MLKLQLEIYLIIYNLETSKGVLIMKKNLLLLALALIGITCLSSGMELPELPRLRVKPSIENIDDEITRIQNSLGQIYQNPNISEQEREATVGSLLSLWENLEQEKKEIIAAQEQAEIEKAIKASLAQQPMAARPLPTLPQPKPKAPPVPAREEPIKKTPPAVPPREQVKVTPVRLVPVIKPAPAQPKAPVQEPVKPPVPPAPPAPPAPKGIASVVLPVILGESVQQERIKEITELLARKGVEWPAQIPSKEQAEIIEQLKQIDAERQPLAEKERELGEGKKEAAQREEIKLALRGLRMKENTLLESLKKLLLPIVAAKVSPLGTITPEELQKRIAEREAKTTPEELQKRIAEIEAKAKTEKAPQVALKPSREQAWQEMNYDDLYKEKQRLLIQLQKGKSEQLDFDIKFINNLLKEKIKQSVLWE